MSKGKVSEHTPLLGDNFPSQSPDYGGDQPVISSDSGASPGWTRKQKLVALALSLQNISLSISFGIMAPFYPGEAAKKGASPTEVGFVFGTFELVIFITAPLYGSYIHKLGAKYMFLSGSFLLGGCSIAFGFLDGCPDGVIYVIMCFISRSIEANGCAMLSTASFAIMAKTFPDDVGKALGLLETFIGIGMAIGPSIGGGLYAIGGYRLPFIVIGCLVWTITLACFFILPRIEDVSGIEGSFLKLLRIPGCIVVYLVIAACAVALSFLDPTFSPFMQTKFEFLTMPQIGLIFMIDPGTYALTAPIAGYFSDKGWLATSTICGMVTAGACFLFLGPSPIFRSLVPNTLVEVCVTLAVLGAGLAFGMISIFPLLLQMAKSAGFDDGIHTLGIVSGLFNSGFSFGAFLGPTAAGWLNNVYGFETSSSICSAIVLLTVLVFTCYVSVLRCQGGWPLQTPPQKMENNDRVHQRNCHRSLSANHQRLINETDPDSLA